MKKYLIVLLSIISSFWHISYAQELGYIKGTVTNEQGETISGVKVEVADLSQTTLDNGFYHIGGILVEKSYSVKFTHTEYEDLTINQLLSPDAGVEKNVILEKSSENEVCKFDVLPEEPREYYMKGKIFDLKKYPIELKNIKIFSSDMNDILKKTARRLTSFCMPNYEEEVKSKISELIQKIKGNEDKNGNVYFLTDDKGEFKIKYNILLFEGNDKQYTFSVEKFRQYKNTEKNITLSRKDDSTLNLEFIMYNSCEEGTGNQFDADCLFPAWATENDKKDSSRQEIRGIYGKNKDGEKSEDKAVFHLIPNIINIILKFVSPIVVVMFIYGGFRFIYAGSDEEDLNKAKDFFLYAAIGLAFIIMSYTLMKVIYFFLK